MNNNNKAKIIQTRFDVGGLSRAVGGDSELDTGNALVGGGPRAVAKLETVIVGGSGYRYITISDRV